MDIRDFEELLEEYRNRGYTLENRTSPQPHLEGSNEQNVYFAMILCTSMTVPKDDPIYLALSVIFNDEIWTRWSLWPSAYFPKNFLVDDLKKILYSLEIFYGSSKVFTHLRQYFSFDEATGTLKFGKPSLEE